MPAVTEHEAEEATKAMMLKDLRIECRARGISPAGGREQLLQRVREHMVESGDCTIKSAGGAIPEDGAAIEAAPAAAVTMGTRNNNYARPEGQNTSNFITDKPSSRVLAAPGGGSSICFGDDSSAAAKPAAGANKSSSPAGKVPAPKASSSPAKIAAAAGGNGAPASATIAATAANVESSGPTGYARNNYARPDGQNLGNYISGRNSSRVLAPPGGGSSIKFG